MTAAIKAVPANMEYSEQNRQSAFEGLIGIPFTQGNSIDILRNGDEIFPGMLDAIRNAHESIEFVTYVYWQGDIAVQFAEALSEKARSGVRVQVVFDAFGAKPMKQRLIDMMRTAGVEIAWFRPLARWKIWNIDNRTHRKILVCDGKVGFTGGVGIAEEWEGDARNPSEWRDTHFRITGPAVDGLRGAFYGNWAETGGRPHEHADDPVEHDATGEAAIQVVRTTASVGWSDGAMVLRAAVHFAQSHLRISTAYFVPDDLTLHMLCDKARKGVDIDIIVPGPHTDERLVQYAGQAYYEMLHEAGVRIHQYQKTMLHNKILTADDQYAVIGSANFNQRSMRRDDEICLVVFDESTVNTLNNQFDEDLESARQIDESDWRKRGVWQRTKEWLASQLRPEL